MLAFNALILLLIFLALIVGLTYWFIIRPAAKRVIDACNARDLAAADDAQHREQAEQDYARLMGLSEHTEDIEPQKTNIIQH